MPNSMRMLRLIVAQPGESRTPAPTLPLSVEFEVHVSFAGVIEVLD